MTAPVLSLTESQIMTALRTFLLACVPSGTEVVRGQGNRVPEPKGAAFIVFTPILLPRLGTNVETVTDGFFNDPPTPGTKSSLQPTSVTVQLDIHGPNSADMVQVITTLFRDQFAVDSFAASGVDVSPLYTGDPKEIPFVNGEQQVETVWVVDIVMQANPSIATPQDFAGALSADLINVDETYPP